jgi:hypothetical protein
MVRSRVLAFILLSFLTISSLAQSSKRETVTQSVQWFALSTHIKVHNSVSILAEGQFRYAQHFDPMQFQFRTGLDFTINKHFSVLPNRVRVHVESLIRKTARYLRKQRTSFVPAGHLQAPHWQNKPEPPLENGRTLYSGAFKHQW